MKIIEQFIKGKKNNQELCEDMLFVGADFIAVADGVTAKSERLFDGKSGGRAAAQAIMTALEEMPAEADAFESTKLFTERVAKLYGGESDGSAAAGVIVFSRARNQIWSIGDCQCIINGELFSHEKEIDKLLSEMRALVVDGQLAKGATIEEVSENDKGRAFILPMLKKQHLLANADGEYSYGILNGTPVPEDKIIIYSVCEGDEIVLASDGYPRLSGTLEESEKYLQKELKENPLCVVGYRSTKGLQKGCDSFDDRTYIRFKV